MLLTKWKFGFLCRSTKRIANIIFGCAKSCSLSLYYRGQNLTAAWQIKVWFIVQGYKKYYNFQIYPPQNTLLTASILEGYVSQHLEKWITKEWVRCKTKPQEWECADDIISLLPMIAKEEKVKLRGANGSPKTAGILSMPASQAAVHKAPSSPASLARGGPRTPS